MAQHQRIPIASIRVDGGTQVRASISGDAVNDYARTLDKLPPPIVCWDGSQYWLVDGFHRLAAHRQVGSLEVDCDVREGDVREARRLAASANVEHGVRRTNRDKRNAVRIFLDDPEWAQLPDRQIADACHVTHPFVAQLRRSIAGGRREDDEGEPAALPEPKREKERTEGEHLESIATEVLQDDASHVEMREAARNVMGAIDIDPRGALDGLTYSTEWRGRAWIELPDEPEAWIDHALDEHADGRLEQACMIARAATGAPWFLAMWDLPLAFIAHVDDLVVAYLGPRVDAFARSFEGLGRVVLPHSGGSASLRQAHRALCAVCAAPCSTGRWCPTCKQFERSDRAWMRAALKLAQRAIDAGKEPSPRAIAVKLSVGWTDVVRCFLSHGIGTAQARAAWQRQATEARKGDDG